MRWSSLESVTDYFYMDALLGGRMNISGIESYQIDYLYGKGSQN